MPFSPNDLYLTSGTQYLINNWVDPVYKFDSSSFYNWEQDNLPIYDLEDRDNYLFEMHGYPTSSVGGMMLTVSDCGVDNKRVFATVSSVIDALPNTIRFPIIIEVASSGHLGEMKLENLQFEGPDAGLEIINRGFAKVLCGSSSPFSTVETVTDSSAITAFSSIDLSNTMTDSSSLGVSTTVYANAPLGALEWWDNYTRAFVLTPEWSEDTDDAIRTITISSNIKDSGTGFLGAANSYNASIYQDYSASTDQEIIHGGSGGVIQRDPIVAGDTTRAVGFVYANSLSNVIIKDCNGKIYIRNFCVDSGNKADINSAGGEQLAGIGFDIQNSDVLVENCTAARCKDAGLQAVNSNVTLNRGFLAFHNYELSTAAGSARHLDTKMLTNPTAGIRAINSTLTLSAALTETYGLPIDAPFCCYRNMVGVDLQGSELNTPVLARKGTNMAGEDVSLNRGSQTIVLQTFFNLMEGIKSTNSTVSNNERVSSFQNNVGLSLDNSEFKVAEITLDHNQEQGLNSKNSTFNYNKNATLAGYTAGPFYPVTNFGANGQHATLSNSLFVPTYVSGMNNIYERMEFSGNHQVNTVNGLKTTLPGVTVDYNSTMENVCTRAIVEDAYESVGKYHLNEGVNGALFRVDNGSTLKFESHAADTTYLFGPLLWSDQQYLAGVYAGNGSKVSFAGPTTLLQMGVNVLVENNSNLEIGPHEKDGLLDVAGWGLENNANQTRTQLHATRACLVADKNSVIDIHDMGDYHEHWLPKYYETVDGGKVPDYNPDNDFGTSAYTRYGELQFFPNPFVPYNTINLVSQATPLAAGGPSLERSYTKLATGTDISDYSWGGMCVRALGDSEVKVRNVNFPAGWLNASEAYYDASADSNCTHLRIWNIADTSKLKASYLSVGGHHPQETSGSYYGPSAVYVSGATEPAWVALSGAPSSTHNTSSLSVLDSFGKGVETNGELGFYGKTEHENIGAFRIYVSPDSKAKYLGYPVNAAGDFFNASGGLSSMGFDFTATGIKAGPPYQVLAQGYNISGDCSATPASDLSSIYQDFGFSGYVSSLPISQQFHNDASSFYYVSSMIPNETQGNIWLDFAAMNTFANAKNGMLGTSGRKKLFNYYEATTDYPGEAFWNADPLYGLGFGSANLFDLDRHL